MSNKNLFITLCVLLLISAFLILAGISISRHKNDKAQQKQDLSVASTFDINPSPKVSPSPQTEPEVTSWRLYTNDTYNFTIEVPNEWNQEDYSSFYPSGGTVIAFSPTHLPCKTCTYFKDGFLSLKIYNQKTDPIFYSSFTERMSNVGRKKDYLQIQLDKKNGVYFSNTAAVENQGWVYEFSFDKDKGTANAIESKIFQKVLFSLKFTKLTFE